jgi:hypothetical protein
MAVIAISVSTGPAQPPFGTRRPIATPTSAAEIANCMRTTKNFFVL